MKIQEIKNGNMNKIYILEINNNKYIVRTSDFNNTFECKVLKLLKNHNYNCPKVITNFELDGKYIMIYRYLEGKNPKEYNDNFFIELSILLRKLHSITYSFNNDEYLENIESQEKLYDFYKNIQNSKYLSNELNFISQLYDSISKLDFNQFDKCIIHSDIKQENMIENNNELYLIDFGNCYIGSRLIDIIRVIMWFFIQYDNYDYAKIKLFIHSYFKNNEITQLEKEQLDELIIYCILYNLLKDVYLNEKGILTNEYIEKNSLKWLEVLKKKDKLLEIGGLIKNA